MITNDLKLWELQNICTYWQTLKKESSKRIGHLERIDHGRVIKEIFESKL